MQKPILQVDNLTFSYSKGQFPVVDQMSFGLNKGSFTSIISRSGEGKSTLIKLLAAQLQPNSGTIWLGKQRVKGPAEVLVPGHNKIALVDQHLVLPLNLTVSEVLHFAMKEFGTPHRRERSEFMLQLAGLQGRENDKPDNLSGGQRQKLSILYALVSEPELLLLDEPFSHLDEATAQEVAQFSFPIIKKWKVTTLMVSHLPQHALAFSDQIIVLKSGKIIESGTPEYLYNHAIQAESSSLLGEMQVFSGSKLMNLFPYLELNPKQKWFIRPFQWKVALAKEDKKVEAQIVSIQFCGAYWRVKAAIKKVVIQLHIAKKPNNHIWIGAPDVGDS